MHKSGKILSWLTAMVLMIVMSTGAAFAEETAEDPAIAQLLQEADIVDTDVSEPSDGCVMMGLPGKYIADAQEGLDRINEIRLEACREGVENPSTGEPLTEADYVPIKWSHDLEYIARIRAAESAVTIQHKRTNGNSCFDLTGPGGEQSWGEVLAWNWSETVTQGINQWYREKSDWVNQTAGAVTGHYTQMIDPENLYVGLGTFCSDYAPYYNCTAGEFSSRSGLDETQIGMSGSCIQLLEVNTTYMTGSPVIQGVSADAAGKSHPLVLIADLAYQDTVHGLPVMQGISWSVNDPALAEISQNGVIKGLAPGKVLVTAQAGTLQASMDYTINKAKQTLTASADASSILVGETAQITASGIGAISYSSSDTSIAVVDSSGKVTGKAKGTAVITVKAAGNGSYEAASATVKINVTLLSTPVLSKVENVNGGVKVTWGSVSGAAKYRVYRKSGSGSWTKIGDTTATTYTDKAVSSGSKYTYTVRCLNSAATVFTSSFDSTGKTITYIAAPALSKVENVNGGVKVTWAKSAGAAKYRVFRKTGTGSWAKLGDTTALTYTDKTAKSGTQYTYTVRCLNSEATAFTSSYDGTGKTITYIAAPVLSKVENVNGGVKVTWTKSAGAAKYRIFRKTGTGSWAKLADTTALTYTDKTVKSGSKYTYTVRCLNSAATAFTSSYDGTGKTITYIAAPTLSKVENVSGGVKVTWAKSAGAAKYRVFRKAGTGSWAKLADTTALTYTDKTVKSGTRYTYTVRCINSAGTAFTSAYNTAGLAITTPAATKAATKAATTSTGSSGTKWVLNTNTKKIHYPSCSSASKIAAKNYATSSESIASLKAKGYEPCKNCKPHD